MDTLGLTTIFDNAPIGFLLHRLIVPAQFNEHYTDNPDTNRFELARDASKLFKHGNLEQKRKLIKTVYSNLELKGKLLRWELKKPFEIMAFCTENRDWQPLVDMLSNNMND